MDENERKVVELRVDPNTGDVVGAIYEGDKIITKKQAELACAMVIFGKGEPFVKMFTRIMKALKLTPSEELLAYHLLDYVSPKDNMLRYEDKLLDIKTIAILLEQEYESTRQVMKRLIDRGVLAVVKTGCPTYAKSGNKHYLKAYIFNPYIATTSSKILKSVYDIFTAAGWNFGVIGNGIENNITI